jgi:hypothetical protein
LLHVEVDESLIEQPVFSIVLEVLPHWGSDYFILAPVISIELRVPPKTKSPHRGEKEDPTLGKNGMPKDRKSRLVRTLTNLKKDPVACKETATHRVADSVSIGTL